MIAAKGIEAVAGTATHLCMAVLQCQNSLSNVQTGCVFIKSTKHPQKAEAVPTIQVLHHNIQIVPTGETVVEPHLQQ